MRNIPIPDQLFLEAQTKAAEVGQSLEKFIADAIQLHLSDDVDQADSVTLTPEQVAIIRKSQAEVREGKGMRREQVESTLAASKAEWLGNRIS